jgi:hypothetical protein
MVLGAASERLPWIGSSRRTSLFVLCFVIILSKYGGGVATVPAYLRDMFGSGMLATSMAG